MLHALTHGWTGLFLGYGLTVIGIWTGLRLIHAQGGRTLWVVKVSIPVMLGAATLWWIIEDLGARFFRTLPKDVTAWLGMGFLPSASALIGVALVYRGSDTHKRGALVREVVTWFRRKGSPRGQLTIAGVPVPLEDETKHFKIIGTTGTGKSTAIQELLAGALKRGDRAVIADPDGAYARRFYDPKRGDIILNPFDERAARWDLFAEILKPHEADQLALALIPDHEGPDRNWRGYARVFLSALLRQLHHANERDMKTLYRLLTRAPITELHDLLDATAAAPFFSKGSGKFLDSVRSVTNVYAACIDHLACQTTGELISIRKWIREGKGVLFLTYRASEIAAIRSLISTWMRIAIFETLDGQEGDQRLWFAIDELDALGAIDGLKDALARLRKFGGRCVLGLQSIGQLRGGQGETEAQTICENCGTTMILRCSASEHGGTSEFASRLIGKREIIRRQTSFTDPSSWWFPGHSSRTKSEQHVTEDAVMPSEIEQLPDLTGFLKLASRPEWYRIVLSHNNIYDVRS